jgi:chromosome partitioning protein
MGALGGRFVLSPHASSNSFWVRLSTWIRSTPVRLALVRLAPLRLAPLRSPKLRFAPLRLARNRFARLRPAPVRSGAAQVGTGQVGAGQVGAAHDGAAHADTTQACAAQIGKAQGGTAQIGVAQVGAVQVDGDEQGSASLFSQLRAERRGSTVGYTAVGLYGSAVRTQVRQLASKYTDTIIDCGGRDTGSLRAALTVSDVVLVPVQPRSFDIWSADQMAALVAEAREINPGLRAVAFLNAADAQGRDNAEAREALAEIAGLETVDLAIIRRKAFPNAAAVAAF